jgi:type 1 glutamine amidotransferase
MLDWMFTSPRRTGMDARRSTRGAAVIRTAVAAATIALFFTAAEVGSQNATPKPIRGLYVTGGGFHDFGTQEAIVPAGIAQRAPVEWTIDHTAGKSTDVLIERHKTTDWAKAFDVVVYNMSFSNVIDPAWIERITGAHRASGVPAVILHGGVHSYRRSESKAWGELMGAFSMRHDKQRPLTIEVVANDHPIMRGFPDKWRTINEELYELERVWPSMTPLAQAYSEETKKSYPVVWINTHGKARVFVTSLGHNNEMMANPVYLDLVTRGLLWTVDRLRADGTASPGESAR